MNDGMWHARNFGWAMAIPYRRRNSVRYPGRDYARPGAVFVTVCTAARQCLFGAVNDGRMVHNPAGEMVIGRWQTIPDRFPTVETDAFVVMPDHVHGIVFTGTNPDLAGMRSTIGDVVRWFKASVQAAYRDGVMRHKWPAFDSHLWRRGFHDRIIRTDAKLAHIQRYIEGNPGRW